VCINFSWSIEGPKNEFGSMSLKILSIPGGESGVCIKWYQSLKKLIYVGKGDEEVGLYHQVISDTSTKFLLGDVQRHL
jgi:hypothetical protein